MKIHYVIKFAGILRNRAKDGFESERFVCTYCGAEFDPPQKALAFSLPFRDDLYVKCPQCGCRRPCRIKRD